MDLIPDRGAKKVEGENGQMITIKQAAKILDVTAPCCNGMYKRGHETLTDMIAYRKTIEEQAGNNGGGCRAYVFKTSEGEMTLKQMVAHHEHDIAPPTLRCRGERWGYDHKSIWLPKMQGIQFRNAAIALDGDPRGEQRGNPTLDKSKDQKINRLRTCHREQGRVKCAHYALRLKTDKGHPEPCLVAHGNVCTNFIGTQVNAHTDSSGRKAVYYGANGVVRVV